MSSYKLEKEQFVSGHNGSSIFHINAISSVALASVALYLTLQSRLAFPSRLISNSRSNIAALVAEFALLVVPLILSMTLFANYPLSLSFLLLVPSILIHQAFPPLPPPAQPSLLPPPSPSTSRPSSPGLTPTPTLGGYSSIHVVPTPVPSPTPRRSTFPNIPPSNSVPPLPALTTWRAHMMLMTVIAILAVDFPVFPRSLGKCESWGVSVMDLGVGSFVFSQGVVSAIPIIKNPAVLKNPLLPKLLTTLKKVVPLLILGLVRVLAVKGTEYPEHVTEYGVHWNFFITLALLPLFSVLAHPLLVHLPLAALGLILTIVHQIVLNNTPLQDWALGNNRTNILDQNKEGIVSFTGYLALHLIGMAIGTLLLPPSPSHFRHAIEELSSTNAGTATPSRVPSPARFQVDKDLHTGRRIQTPDSSDDDEPRKKPSLTLTYPNESVSNQPRKRGKAAIELCSYAVVWWSLFYFGSTFSGNGAQGVSRRLANTLYVLWVAAFNTSFLVGYVLLDSIYPVSQNYPQTVPRGHSLPAASDRLRASNPSPARKMFAPSFKLPGGSESIRERSPPVEANGSGLLGAINLNGLALFLLANVATGLVNLTIPTMYTPDGQAMGVLLVYSFVFSLCAWIFRRRRILSMI